MTSTELAKRLRAVVADMEADKIQCGRVWCIRDGIPYDPIGYALKDIASTLNYRSAYQAFRNHVDGGAGMLMPFGCDLDDAMMDFNFANDRDGEWADRKDVVIKTTQKLVQVLEERATP